MTSRIETLLRELVFDFINGEYHTIDEALDDFKDKGLILKEESPEISIEENEAVIREEGAVITEENKELMPEEDGETNTNINPNLETNTETENN